MRGHPHDDHVGGVRGLVEIAGGAQGFGQRDVVTEVLRVPMVLLMSSTVSAERTHCLAHGGRRWTRRWSPRATENDDLRFAVIRCHGDNVVRWRPSTAGFRNGLPDELGLGLLPAEHHVHRGNRKPMAPARKS